MARIKLYQRSPAQQYVGVPQQDNSGSIIASAVAGSANVLADQANQTQANDQYMSRFMLNQATSDIGQMLAQNKREQAQADRLAAQNAKAIKTADDRNSADAFTTDYKTAGWTAEITARDSVDPEAPVNEQIQGYADKLAGNRKAYIDQLNQNGKLNYESTMMLEPQLRTADEASVGRFANYVHEKKVQDGPVLWKNRLNSYIPLASQIGAKGPQDWDTPLKVETNIQDYTRAVQNVIEAKPDVVMGQGQIFKDKRATEREMAKAVITNVARNAPEMLDQVRGMKVFREGLVNDGTAVFEADDYKQQDELAHSRIGWMNQKKQEAYEVAHNTQEAEETSRMIGIDRQNNEQVIDSLTQINAKIPSVKAALDAIDAKKDPFQHKLLTEQLKGLVSDQQQFGVWKQQNIDRAKANTDKDAAKRIQDADKAALAKYNSQEADSFRENQVALYRNLPTIKKVREVGATEAEKRALKQSIAQYRTILRNGLRDGYFSKPTEKNPGWISNQKGYLDNLEKVLDGADYEPGIFDQIMNRTQGSVQADDPYHVAIGVAGTKFATLADFHVQDEVMQTANAYEEKRASGATINGKALPPISQELINDWVAKVQAKKTYMKSETTKELPSFNPLKTATEAGTKVSTTKQKQLKGKAPLSKAARAGDAPPPPFGGLMSPSVVGDAAEYFPQTPEESEAQRAFLKEYRARKK